MIEFRSIPGIVEMHPAEAEKSLGVVTGLAPMYGVRSQDMGGFVEVVTKDAAAKTVGDVKSGRNLVADFEHRNVLANTRSGTLIVTNGPTGVSYRMNVPDVTAGRDLITLMGLGVVDGSSFGFRAATPPEWAVATDGIVTKSYNEISLFTVGPVSQPAFEDSPAQLARSLRSLATDEHDVDEIIRLANKGLLAEFVTSLSAQPPTDRRASTFDFAAARKRLQLLDLSAT